MKSLSDYQFYVISFSYLNFSYLLTLYYICLKHSYTAAYFSQNSERDEWLLCAIDVDKDINIFYNKCSVGANDYVSILI